MTPSDGSAFSESVFPLEGEVDVFQGAPRARAFVAGSDPPPTSRPIGADGPSAQISHPKFRASGSGSSCSGLFPGDGRLARARQEEEGLLLQRQEALQEAGLQQEGLRGAGRPPPPHTHTSPLPQPVTSTFPSSSVASLHG